MTIIGVNKQLNKQECNYIKHYPSSFWGKGSVYKVDCPPNQKKILIFTQITFFVKTNGTFTSPAFLVLFFLRTLEETFRLKFPKIEFVLSALGGIGGGVFPLDKSKSSSPISSTYSESFTGFNKILPFPS